MTVSDQDRETAKARLDEPHFRNVAYLISKGVPFEVATTMSCADVLAFTVAFGEYDGGTFDWETLSWLAAKPAKIDIHLDASKLHRPARVTVKSLGKLADLEVT